MLDDLYLTANIKTAQDAALRPPPVPTQAASFSAWRATTAAPRGVVAGGAQSGGFFADVLGAFGQASAASYTGDMLGNMTDQQRRQTEEAGRKMRTEGLDFSSTAGDQLRGFSRELSPDPETAHAAERLVFDFARVASKAVGYTLAGGPVSGAVLTAGDEAMAVADDLKQQGVDLGTRTKVGAVVGAVTGLGVGLPMAGNTLRQTAGLVALGGPVSFVAQQQAVRSILQSANYDALAEQYDPLDPVGLAVSTLIPAGFGAWGLRAARARQVKADAAARAQADADFAAGPVPSEQMPVAAAAREATTEQVDAARVMLSRQARDASSPFRPDDWRAFDAHEQALARAADQMARGERVAVGDMLPPVMETAEARAVRAEIETLQQERAQLVPVAEQLAERGAIRTARQELAAMEQQRPDISDAAARDLAKQIQSQQRVSYKAALSQARAQLEGAQQDFVARQQRLNQSIETNASAQQATQRLGEIDSRIGELEAQMPPESRLPRFAQQLQAAGRQIETATQEARSAQQATRAAEPPAMPAAAQPPGADAPGPAGSGAPAADPAARAGDAAAPAGLVDEAAGRRIGELEASQPGLLVRLDGMDEARPLSEVLAAIKAEADEMKLDGELMEVAAQCALQNGG